MYYISSNHWMVELHGKSRKKFRSTAGMKLFMLVG
jgi:hypothetical protein